MRCDTLGTLQRSGARLRPRGDPARVLLAVLWEQPPKARTAAGQTRALKRALCCADSAPEQDRGAGKPTCTPASQAAPRQPRLSAQLTPSGGACMAAPAPAPPRSQDGVWAPQRPPADWGRSGARGRCREERGCAPAHVVVQRGRGQPALLRPGRGHAAGGVRSLAHEGQQPDQDGARAPRRVPASPGRAVTPTASGHGEVNVLRHFASAASSRCMCACRKSCTGTTRAPTNARLDQAHRLTSTQS
jgi:hypothetical protein